MTPASDFTTARPTVNLGAPRIFIKRATSLAAYVTVPLLIITVLLGSRLSNFAWADSETIEGVNEGATLNFSSFNTAVDRRHIVFQKGDTLISVLAKADIRDNDISAASSVLAKKVRLNKIPVGQTLHLYLEQNKETSLGKSKLLGLMLHGKTGQHWTIYRALADQFTLQKLSEETAVKAIHSYQHNKKYTSSTSFSHTITMGRGDTLMNLLDQVGLNREQIQEIVRKLRAHMNLRRLHIGQTFELRLQTIRGRTKLLGLTTTNQSDGHAKIQLNFQEPEDAEQNPSKKTVSTANTGYKNDAKSNPPVPAPADIDRVSTLNGIAPPPPLLLEEVMILRKGQAIFNRLLAMGIDIETVHEATDTLSQNLDFSKLQVGQKIRLLFAEDAELEKILVSIIIPIKASRVVQANRREDGKFESGSLSLGAVHKFLKADSKLASVNPKKTVAQLPKPDEVYIEIATIARGDTLETLLRKHRVPARETRSVLTSLQNLHDSNDIRAGQKLALEFERTGSEYRLRRAVIGIRKNKTIVVQLKNDNYHARQATGKPIAEAIQLSRKLDSALADLEAGRTSPILLQTYRFDIANNALVNTTVAKRITVLIRPGDTLSDAIVKAGVTPADAHKAILAAKPLANPRKLKPGQTIHLAFAKPPPTIKSKQELILAELLIDLNPRQRLRVARLLDGTFVSGFVVRPLLSKLRQAHGIINSSLYEAASARNVPPKTLAKLIRVFSYDVDFQRDIRKGDEFEIFYEILMDEEEQVVDSGGILYSSLTLSGSRLNVYKFLLSDGITEDHFDDEGRSIRKALMRTPIDGARLTSSFGNRKHPTLGYTKMHRGVDFGAPKGTPIFAAGDGVVDKLGSHGAYGNYIRLRHGLVYHTAYAHLHKYANRLHSGQRVKQGDVIGFVGSTGRSTGPHLHYEVLKYGKQVNPLGVKLPSGLALEGLELANFQREKQLLLDQFVALATEND
jgi:murein DD-endopeptidase MepM/ murein hydrolase activator NlpD